MNIGDIVRLRSGGPKMTVSSIDDDEISCIWFSGTTDRGSMDETQFWERDFKIDVLEEVGVSSPRRKKPKLLVTERDSDLEAAKHEIDEYLKKKAK